MHFRYFVFNIQNWLKRKRIECDTQNNKNSALNEFRSKPPNDDAMEE